MNNQPGGDNMYLQSRKTKSLFKWLANVTGMDAIWIEGIDKHDKPIWGLVKQLSHTCWYVASKKLKATTGMAALVGILLLPVDSLYAQTGITLNTLTGPNGFTLNGVDYNDRSGNSLASGDINGDGIDDLIIGSKHADPNSWESGETYVVFGQSNSINFSSIELSSLDGNTGFILHGIHPFDESGYAVVSGDINGDGIDDVIIGANRAAGQAGEYNMAGETYVMFGKTTAFNSVVELSSLDGSTGFMLHGIDNNDQSGTAVASGDINGDGKDDVIIGASNADPNGINAAGETYVVFGFNDTAIDTLLLSSMDGSTGFVFKGINELERNGRAVASGDINGDGTDDVIIGAYGASPNGGWSGETYVVFGKSTAFTSTLGRTILDGNTGFVLHGINGSDQSGRAVASGDINGDGTDDVIVGARFADPNGINTAGETYVVFGKSTAFNSVVELSSLDGSTGFVLNGIDGSARSGHAVASGDIDGDGKDDVIIGAFGTHDVWPNGWKGETYVVFGFDDATTDAVELSSLDGSTGFVLNGINDRDYSGGVVASGDINGDGKTDVIIGAYGANSFTGETYVFTQFPAAVKLKGIEGLRMLAAPASGTILDEFLVPLWTQGMTGGADTPEGAPNLWIWDETLDSDGFWTPISDLSGQHMNRGQGFLMWVYSDDDFNGTPDGFPKMLNSIDIFSSMVVDTGTVTPVTNLEHGRFFLAGNPYPSTFDWDSAPVTKINLSNAIYIYDGTTEVYQAWNGTAGSIIDGHIAPFQSFFIQAHGGTGSLTIGDESQVDSSATFYKQLPNQEPRILSIHAKAGDNNVEAWLSFQDGGTLERDIYDALYLHPITSRFLKLGTILDSGEVLQINALPVDLKDELVLPLDLSGTIEATHATLSFNNLEAFHDWELSLRDTHTGEEFLIEKNTSLELEIESIRARLKQSLLPSPAPVKAKSIGSRYQIVVVPAVSISNEEEHGIPSSIELQQNYPNPFNPVTTINYSISVQTRVRLEVFDLMGRKITELLNKPMPAGRYSVNFDASALPSGMYVYRLQAGSQTLVRKMTLIK